jgi:DNA-binding transcriptional regulator YbjK
MAIRPPTHRAVGEARRAQLLDAAIEVIAEKGVGGATHRAIATRAGMALSTTSYFFASIDDLIAAALQLVADRVVARIDEQVRVWDAGEHDVEDAVDMLADLLLGSPASNVVAQFEIYLECTRRPALQATAHQIMASLERGAEAALRMLGVERPTERAPMLVALLDGLALHRRAWPRGESDRRALREALTFFAEACRRDNVTA